MARRPMPGLTKRGQIWHIDKCTPHAPEGRLRESTGVGELDEAERYLVHRLEELRKAAVYGIRPKRQFEEAATKYLLENTHKASIRDDGRHLKQMMPYIGELYLHEVYDDTLQPFVQYRLDNGIKPKSINLALSIVRRILNLAARSWRENGLTWLEQAPLITMLPLKGTQAEPYPLSWDEQKKLLKESPDHLAEMALYKVNTGSREQEVCQLSWEWEQEIPEIGHSVFVVPAWVNEEDGRVKNREDRLIVLNTVARSVIEAKRASRPQAHLEGCKSLMKGKEKGRCNCAYGVVFTYRGYQVGKMNNSGWKTAWRAAGLPVSKKVLKGVHNLKHTFGRRLRAAGVQLETRKVLLGHTTGDITTHYSAPEIEELVNAAEMVCGADPHNFPTLTLIKKKAG